MDYNYFSDYNIVLFFCNGNMQLFNYRKSIEAKLKYIKNYFKIRGNFMHTSFFNINEINVLYIMVI